MHVDRKPHPRDAWCNENSLFLAFPQYPVGDIGTQRHTSTLGPVPVSDELDTLRSRGRLSKWSVVTSQLWHASCFLILPLRVSNLKI